jgi:hypothetical protein
MKAPHPRFVVMASATVLLLAFSLTPNAAAEGPRLMLTLGNAQVHLEWPGSLTQPDGTTTQPWFEVQQSSDLQRWQPLGQRLRSAAGETARFDLPANVPHGFYRVVAVTPQALASPGEGGAEVFGYQATFDAELNRIGQISTDDFAKLYPSGAQYLPEISWDPTTAKFWDQFSADPAVVNQGKTWGSPGYRSQDYRMNGRELELFRRNGFVVSERLAWNGVAGWLGGGLPSMGNAFYQLWYNDLPVFISTDAVLHAWHRTYNLMLEELESAFLYQAAQDLLQRMDAGIPAAWASAGNGVLRESLLDADYLVTVARSLIVGSQLPSPLKQDSRVATTLADIREGQLKQIPDFMGFCRTVDFSQFEPRGHYTHSVQLRRYFQCLMWLGRIDLPVAGGPFERCPGDPRLASPRELGTTLVLHHLIDASGAMKDWRAIDTAIGTFVGWSDSLTVPQLGGLLAGAGISSLADVPDLATLERIQSLISQGELGVQNIRSDAFFTPLSDGSPVRLPQTFLIFGQRFIPDSWAFSQTVYDSIQWTENGTTWDVPRRVPSALDVAFAVLGNNQVVPNLVAQIQRTPRFPSPTHAELFRDGHPYQHNLAAARATLDAQKPEAWNTSVALGWLGALRELSHPTTDAAYPESMRTHAWAMRTLNTQLASWTQYRHNTILYAKQSYTSVPICFYPAGFVEPRLEFWQRLHSVIHRSADALASIDYPDAFVSANGTHSIYLPTLQSNQVAHLRLFADHVDILAAISQKELAQVPLSADEESFLRNVMQDEGTLPFGCAGMPRYSGWYPKLFYRPFFYTQAMDYQEPWMFAYNSDEDWFHEKHGANAADLIIADVHTDLPAPGDPGSVLHQAVGGVGLMVVAVDNGADRMVYAGPVMTHYELEVLGPPRRLNDDEWASIHSGRSLPNVLIEGLQPPPWTTNYFVPD